MSLANLLMSKQKEEEARRIAVEALQMLEQAPDHPRVAAALGSVVSIMARLGMRVEAERTWAGVIDKRKHPSVNNWPDGQRVLLTLRERTVSPSGESSLDHAHILEHAANRASQNREFDQALAWMDEAIEIARALPDAGVQVAGMMREREQIAQAKQAPPGGPFYGPSRVPVNRGGPVV
jgi:hypothetical protein